MMCAGAALARGLWLTGHSSHALICGSGLKRRNRAQMAEFLEPSSPEDAPPQTVEMDAISLFVEAYIAAEGPKKGRRLLVEAARLLELREVRTETIVEFLPPAEAAAKKRVRRATRAWFRRKLPAWLQRLDGG